MTDPIADMLTRLRNANSAYHDRVSMPHSKLKAAIARFPAGSLQFEQGRFSPNPAAVPAQLSVLVDDPVTRDQQRDRVPGEGRARRPDGTLHERQPLRVVMGQRDLRGYFPPAVVERFGHLLAEHPQLAEQEPRRVPALVGDPVGFQPEIEPSRLAKKKSPAPLLPPVLRTKSFVVLNTWPVGPAGGEPRCGIVTTKGAPTGNGCPCPLYSVAVPAPWLETQNGPVGGFDSPHGLIRFGSVNAAGARPSAASAA